MCHILILHFRYFSIVKLCGSNTQPKHLSMLLHDIVPHKINISRIYGVLVPDSTLYPVNVVCCYKPMNRCNNECCFHVPWILAISKRINNPRANEACNNKVTLGRFSITAPSYEHSNYYHKDGTIVSYNNGILYIGKTTSLCWADPCSIMRLITFEWLYVTHRQNIKPNNDIKMSNYIYILPMEGVNTAF